MLAYFKQRIKLESQLDEELTASCPEIVKLCKSLSFPFPVIHETLKVYEKIKEADIEKKQRKNRALVATCIFIGCRNANLPKPLKEICRLTRSSIKETTRNYYIISKKCQLVYNVSDLVKNYVAMICEKLHIPVNIQHEALTLATTGLDTTGVCGRRPKTVAASAVYVVCERSGFFQITLSKLAEETQTNVATLRVVVGLLSSKQ
ncbi:transcription initiation factor IIB-like protein [Leptotrombidium deliense]|uniref:Transcription initiation factor IIB-like protein n=1 Tax=Leptotrombidium deliense TaxID=299467 RepID=A0A443RYY5_9ACAR|nr:transcription initiation factor IIB-like protein [Leptotrombidium deliense]